MFQKPQIESNLMVILVVGGPRLEQTQDFCDFQENEGLHIFDEVLIDLVPKVAQILPKVAPNPWGFGFGLIQLQVRKLCNASSVRTPPSLGSLFIVHAFLLKVSFQP